ncbi:lysylphosphatidylglycerol synthase transmembrane domain-containing protein [Marinibacterium profundimaris]|uniref:lysylphosphatidylglycerol synthase transmembrane domain-containing protein n=1 Tax=Marinibacterium profundimaris TaxID=1679460 RepID=UPI000B51ECFB|nr:lysylphosphatidylglycerol synthase transmembrane domain-containing protein [Marinibacterium profundimaris]
MSRAWILPAQVAVTALLFVLLWRQLDGAEVARKLSGAAPGWLLAALVALILQTALSALRWQIVARAFGIGMRLRQAMAEYFLAQAVNQSLPGGVLGDVGRAVRARGAAGLARAGQSVLVERLWGQAALFALLVAGVAGVTLAPGGLRLPDPLVLGVALAALIAGAAGLILMRARALPDRAMRMRDALLLPGSWPWPALLSLGTATMNLLAFAFCARATGTDLGPAAVLALVPVILFTMVLPVSVSGWGLREGAAAALFPLAGASAEAGLAASVAFGLVFLVSALPGLPVLIFTRRAARPADHPTPLPACPGLSGTPQAASTEAPS